MSPKKNHQQKANIPVCRMVVGMILCMALLWTPVKETPAEENRSEARYSVDFELFAGRVPDGCGWIIQEGTDINYPVVRGKDNKYYTNHLFSKKYNRAGAIYMDCENDKYFSDKVTWLYGHGCAEDSLFRSLALYMEQSYLNEHPSFFLLTPRGDYQVDIFAGLCDAGAKTGWPGPQQFASGRDFEEYVAGIRAKSAIQASVQVQWGDRLLVLSTCGHGRADRYVVFGKVRPLPRAVKGRIEVSKIKMDALESVSKIVTIPGRGEMQYYAQNDPIWERMRYEASKSSKLRRYGEGGCGPAAVAIVLANLATDSQLLELTAYTHKDNGFTFCPCSVNQFYCNRTHLPYKIKTPQEMRRYLPIVTASFATGNNRWSDKSRTMEYGTGTSFMKLVADICQLEFSAARSLDKALDTLAAGGLAVVVSIGYDSPFTRKGHYFVLAHADEEHLYFLDPLLRDHYDKTDRKGLLTVLEPGVLRADKADINRILLYGYYMFKRQ